MKVLNIGGATAIIEHNNKRMMFDPWMDNGIFHGSWFHYPPLKMSITDIGHLDYIYISHIHEDHCSYGTLKELNSDAEIIIMDRRPNFVARFLEKNKLNFAKVHLISPKTPTEISPGLVVDMLEADPANAIAHIIDSSLILNWDGYKIFNANDCTPHADSIEYLNKNYPNLDLAFLPYSGGSGYPSCFTNLDDETKRAEQHRIINMRVQIFIDTTIALQPKKVMPFADQFIVGGSRAYLNEFIAHGTGPHIVLPRLQKEKMSDTVVLLNSGQRYDFESEKKTPSDDYKQYTEQEKRDTIKSLELVTYDYQKIKFNNNISLDNLVKYARLRMWNIQRKNKYFPEYRIYLNILNSDLCYCIDFKSDIVQQCNKDTYIQPYLKVSAPYDLMIMILLGHISWNIADAALFLDYERVPNTYDTTIVVYLNHIRL